MRWPIPDVGRRRLVSYITPTLAVLGGLGMVFGEGDEVVMC